MIPIDNELNILLTLLRVSLIFGILYAIVTVMIFEFVHERLQFRAMIGGFFVSAFLAGFLERLI